MNSPQSRKKWPGDEVYPGVYVGDLATALDLVSASLFLHSSHPLWTFFDGRMLAFVCLDDGQLGSVSLRLIYAR